MKFLKVLLGYIHDRIDKYYNIYLIKKHNLRQYEDFRDIGTRTTFCRITLLKSGIVYYNIHQPFGVDKCEDKAEDFINSWISGREL